MNELLIYGPIDWWTSAEFIKSFALIEGDNLVVRINSGGGNPDYGFGMIKKFREFEGKKLVKVDGAAHSTAAFFVLFAKEVEAIQQAQFLIHRASYGEYYESNYMSDEERSSLEAFNQEAFAAFKAKIDVNKFEEITGKKLKDIFSMDAREEVILTAKQAKQIGLISKIVTLTPEMRSNIVMNVDRVEKLAANSSSIKMIVPELEAEMDEKPPVTKKQINKVNMNIAELQAQHPELYAQVLAMGVTNERDRVGAWMAMHDIDAKRVKTGIESGATMSQKDIAEFSVTAMKKMSVSTLEQEGEENEIDTDGGDENKGEEKKPEMSASAKQIDDLTSKITGK